LKDFTKLQTSVSDNICIFLFVRCEVAEECLGLRRWCKLGEGAENLTTSDSTDVNVVTEDSDVGRRDGEWNLGESRIEGINIYNCILLIVKSKRAK